MIEYPVTEESLHAHKVVNQQLANRVMREANRADEYRARALALVAQADKLRAAFRLAESNERDALRLMLITRGAMAIMEDCERQQIAQVRAWIRNQQGRVMRSVDADALREIFGIEEAV